MSFELEKASLKICESLKETNSKLIMNTDVIIPDTKPDVLNVLDVSALSSVEEKQVQDNKINISGKVHYTILYSAGDEIGEIKSILYTVPFKEEVSIEGLDENSLNYVLVSVAHIEPTIVNSRKMNIKTVLNFEICALKQKNCVAVCSVDSEYNLPFRKEKLDILGMAVCSQNSFFVSDELKVSAGNGIDEVLKTEVAVVSKEVKAMNNKLVIKGSVLTDILYVSEGELYHTENETPFTEVVDAQGLTPEMDTELKYTIHSFEVEPISNENLINFEGKVDVVLKAYDEETYEVISDIYSPDYEVDTPRESCEIRTLSDVFKENFTVTEVVTLQDSKPNILKVFSFGVTPHVDTITAADGNAIIDGYLNAKIMYLTDSESSPIYSSEKKIPLSLRVNNKKIRSDSVLDIEVACEHAGYILKSEKDFEVRASVKAGGKIISKTFAEVISDVKIREDAPICKENQPGIVIYFADKEENLWNIAKRYNTTTAEIAQLNGIEENATLTDRQQLIIPKRFVI